MAEDTPKSEPVTMERVRVVLVRPQVAGNIGAVARLMENFNAGRLMLVDPVADPQTPEAVHRSTHGRERLENACCVPTIAEALNGVVYAVGTSRRAGPVHQADDLSPRQMASILRDKAHAGDVAVMFGTEDNGLSREDLLSCDAVVNIPAHPEFATLNLSHAVCVCLYELYLAIVESVVDRPSRVQSDPADRAMMDRLTHKLQHALLTIGYLRPEKPDHLMFPIRAILARADLTRAEAQILMGLAQQIDEFARYGK